MLNKALSQRLLQQNRPFASFAASRNTPAVKSEADVPLVRRDWTRCLIAHWLNSNSYRFLWRNVQKLRIMGRDG
jgi:hypothetical protein